MKLVTIDLDKLKFANMTGTNLRWVNEVDISNAIVIKPNDIILTKHCEEVGKYDSYTYTFVQEVKTATLNKIKSEIKGLRRIILKDTPKDDWAVKWNNCLNEVLDIVDKYKTGSEIKE